MTKRVMGSVRAELLKMKHTFLIPFHVAVSVIIAGFMLFYYRGTIGNPMGQTMAYFELIGIGLPFVVSIVCAGNIGLEEQNHFQVFSDENNQIQIVITGASAIAAATAVAECSTRREPDSGDFLINYGSCAGRKNIPVGTVSLCNKLTQTVDGRTFYPDILYRHPFGEAELYSFPTVQDQKSFQQFLNKDAGAGNGEKGILVDMEAAAIYQAGNYYYAPHQMLLGGGVIVQRFGDLVRGRRSNQKRIEEGLVTPTLSATPGDLSLVLPKRILDGIIEMIYALDKIAPGTANDDTLLYGVEVKFYNMEVELDENLQSRYPGLYIIGDGSGVTHSLSHASASGVYVARHILESEGKAI